MSYLGWCRSHSMSYQPKPFIMYPSHSNFARWKWWKTMVGNIIKFHILEKEDWAKRTLFLLKFLVIKTLLIMWIAILGWLGVVLFCSLFHFLLRSKFGNFIIEFIGNKAKLFFQFNEMFFSTILYNFMLIFFSNWFYVKSPIVNRK